MATEAAAFSKQDAVNQQQSIIVKAPAGSGKTELLVQRYLALLARGCDDPCQLVAITFTRKAAAEMRNRIRAELAQQKAPPEAHKLFTYKLAQEVKERAAARKWNPALLVSEDNVTTIDSFCHRLVSLDPLKAGFMTMPEVQTDEEIKQLYREAAGRALELMRATDEYGEQLRHLLYIHSNSPGKLKSAIADLLEQRIKLLPALHERAYKPQQQLQLLLAELVASLRQDLPAGLLDQLLVVLDQLRPALEEARGYDHGFDSMDWRRAELADWRGLAELLFTKTSGTLKKRFTKNDGFAADDPLAKEFRELVERLRSEADANWLERLADCRTWYDRYTAQELASVEAAQTMIRLAAASLNQIFKEQNKCDHTEMMLAAIEVMGQEHSPSLLAERLGYGLRHLLVDEFQDTSLGQLKLLHSLTSHWDLSGNNSLFLVGDPMQSIYAFRQADVRIFNQLWDEQVLGQIPLARLTLAENYRSQEAIVGWFNDNFAHIFPRAADNLINGVAYTPAKATVSGQRQDEPVHLSIIYDKKARLTNRQLFAPMLAQLQRIRADSPTASIGILARSRSSVAGLIPLLSEAQLDFDASKFSAVQDNPVIMDLMALTRALYNSQDEVAWYACLRAPWCGLQLADMLALARLKRAGDNGGADEEASAAGLDAAAAGTIDGADAGSIWALLEAIVSAPAKYREPLSQDALNRITHFVRALEHSILARRRNNWHDVIAEAWQQLGGDTLIRTQEDLSAFELFMSQVRKSSAGGLLNLSELQAKLEQARIGFESQAKIKLMTIHHAKGLEFDYVFIANMNKRVGGGADANKLLSVSNFIVGDAKQDISIISINSPMNEPQQEPINLMVKGIQDKQSDQEARRLLYVASSRARQGLYFHYAVRSDFTDTDEAERMDKLREGKGVESRSLLYLIRHSVPSQQHESKHHTSYDLDSLRGGRGGGTRTEAPLLRRIKSSELSAGAAAAGAPRQDDAAVGAGVPSLAKKGAQAPQETASDTAAPPAAASPHLAAPQPEQERDTAPFPAWQDPYARCLGLAVHQLMESLAAKSAAELQAMAGDAKLRSNFLQQLSSIIALQLRQAGMSAAQIAEINKSVAAMLQRCLADERALWMLGAEGLAECELAHNHGKKVLRLDRTFVADGVRWIVDYKVSSAGNFSEEDLEGFFAQLRGYGAAVQSMQHVGDGGDGLQEQLPIKLGVYCPEDGFWQERDFIGLR